jgi:hypothetical protein
LRAIVPGTTRNVGDHEDEREVAAIEAAFEQAGYNLQVDEIVHGSWSAVYSDRRTGLVENREPQGTGSTELRAARAALADFRATRGAGAPASSSPTTA